MKDLEAQTPGDFSLVLGGPLYQLWRGTHLAGDALQLLRRRIIMLTLLAWAPLLALSVAEGHFWGGSVALPFLHDVELHVRLLLALPLLIVAELVVNQRMRPMVGQFLDRGLIPDAARAQFDAAIASAMRLRNSITAEVLLIALVYVVGVGFVWRTQLALDVASWYGAAADGTLRPSLAGWWLGLVSLPLFQFLLLRWYLPDRHLDPLPVAGVAHRVGRRADASGPLRRPGLSGAHQLRVRAVVARRRARCWPG